MAHDMHLPHHHPQSGGSENFPFEGGVNISRELGQKIFRKNEKFQN